MKIIRDKKREPKTEEEKELDDYRRAKNIGLASIATGGTVLLSSRLAEKASNKDKYPSMKTIKKVDPRVLKLSGIGLSGIGLGLHGVGAVKYNSLKKKLKKEKEKDDNPEKKD